MYAPTNTSNLSASFLHGACEAWGRLHTEREDVCEALLTQSQAMRSFATDGQESDLPTEDTARELDWRRREALQARLRQIDDALDRLMAGAYGRCSFCGHAIEADRLVNDAAISRCVICQKESENNRRFRTL